MAIDIRHGLVALVGNLLRPLGPTMATIDNVRAYLGPDFDEGSYRRLLDLFEHHMSRGRASGAPWFFTFYKNRRSTDRDMLVGQALNGGFRLVRYRDPDGMPAYEIGQFVTILVKRFHLRAGNDPKTGKPWDPRDLGGYDSEIVPPDGITLRQFEGGIRSGNPVIPVLRGLLPNNQVVASELPVWGGPVKPGEDPSDPNSRDPLMVPPTEITITLNEEDAIRARLRGTTVVFVTLGQLMPASPALNIDKKVTQGALDPVVTGTWGQDSVDKMVSDIGPCLGAIVTLLPSYIGLALEGMLRPDPVVTSAVNPAYFSMFTPENHRPFLRGYIPDVREFETPPVGFLFTQENAAVLRDGSGTVVDRAQVTITAPTVVEPMRATVVRPWVVDARTGQLAPEATRTIVIDPRRNGIVVLRDWIWANGWGDFGDATSERMRVFKRAFIMALKDIASEVIRRKLEVAFVEERVSKGDVEKWFDTERGNLYYYRPDFRRALRDSYLSRVDEELERDMTLKGKGLDRKDVESVITSLHYFKHRRGLIVRWWVRTTAGSPGVWQPRYGTYDEYRAAAAADEANVSSPSLGIGIRPGEGYDWWRLKADLNELYWATLAWVVNRRREGKKISDFAISSSWFRGSLSHPAFLYELREWAEGFAAVGKKWDSESRFLEDRINWPALPGTDQQVVSGDPYQRFSKDQNTKGGIPAFEVYGDSFLRTMGRPGDLVSGDVARLRGIWQATNDYMTDFCTRVLEETRDTVRYGDRYLPLAGWLEAEIRSMVEGREIK